MQTNAEEPAVQKLENYGLKHVVETTASQETIWRLWSDVENWNTFDTLLEYSYLKEGQEFETGGTGYLKAATGPKTKFILTDVNAPHAFSEKLKLPLWQVIELKRSFEPAQEEGKTAFVHEVHFKGGLKPIYYAALASTFKKELVLVMGRLKALAEKLEAEANAAKKQIAQ